MNWSQPSGLSSQRVVCASPENRAMLFLAHMLTARALNFHDSMPGPVLTMPSGADVGGFEWADTDYLLERGYIVLTEETAAPTPAGRVAAKRWLRRYKLEVAQ